MRILLRADSGFCRDALMAWAEGNRVDYLFGLARNARLSAEIEAEMQETRTEAEATGKPARRFRDFTWSTRDSWARERRVIGPPRAPARVRSADRIDRLLTVDGRMAPGAGWRQGQSALRRHVAQTGRGRGATSLRDDVLRAARSGSGC